MKTTEKFISCDCHAHGLLMDYIIEENFDELFLTMYGDGGYYSKPSIGYRIKHAFKILCGGEIHGGELVFNKDKAEELKLYLEEFISKIK